MIGRLPDVFERQGIKLRLAGAVDVVVPLSAQSVPSSPSLFRRCVLIALGRVW